MSSPRAPYVALFVSLGLAAAFLVSALAEIGRQPSVDSLADVTDGDARTLPTPVPIRIEVLNGAGVGGLARDATQRLRAGGFDVVFFGNAGRFDHHHSVVLDRTGDPARAHAVAAALGIDSVATALDSTLFLDATVVLGADWPPPPPDAATALDRLRRLLASPDTGS